MPPILFPRYCSNIFFSFHLSSRIWSSCLYPDSSSQPPSILLQASCKLTLTTSEQCFMCFHSHQQLWRKHNQPTLAVKAYQIHFSSYLNFRPQHSLDIIQSINSFVLYFISSPHQCLTFNKPLQKHLLSEWMNEDSLLMIVI